MKKVIMVVLALGLMVSTAYADQAALKTVKDMEVVKSLLGTAGLEILDSSDMGNLYEIIVEQQKQRGVLYVTKDGKYLVQGALYDVSKRNVTKERFDELNKVEFSKVPLSDAITIKKGTGAKKVIMITDVDCPFCKKGYEWFEGQNNYTLYVYLLPIPQLHPKAYEKSVKVLCSKDPVQALSLTKSDKDIPGEKCDEGEKKLKRQMEISQGLGASGTPLFILENGDKITGFNQQALEEYLKK